MSFPEYPEQYPPRHHDGPNAPQSPTPPPYPPGPPAGYPTAPIPIPAKRRRWLIPILVGGFAFVALCCGGLFVAGALSDPEPAANDEPPAAAAPAGSSPPVAPTKAAPAPEDGPKTYKIGQPVRGGDFEFVVHAVKCGIPQVGSEFLNQKAQGAFCRVDLSVKNVTKSPHLFHADGTVTVQDSAAREYGADGEAGVYGNKDAAGFLDEINPGNSIRAFVFFDVPKGTKLATLTFDAGLFTLAEDAVVKL